MRPTLAPTEALRSASHRVPMGATGQDSRHHGPAVPTAPECPAVGQWAPDRPTTPGDRRRPLPGRPLIYREASSLRDYAASTMTEFLGMFGYDDPQNGLPTDKPAVTEDVNIYQKYIARFSGSQHCGHIHCAYQYREHYHCLDPECNYQVRRSLPPTTRGLRAHGRARPPGQLLSGRNGQQATSARYPPAPVKQEPSENAGAPGAHEASQDRSLDLTVKEPSNESNGHTVPANSSLLSSLMNKHKSYHIKDDAYAKDGFKKFYKYEECKYEGCVYSKATNHFHCIRAGCGFTFTSTSQMTSHKRKHERRHVRAGALGPPPALLGAKDPEQEESSNDDLVDFSALSSKNSSLSASPTSQQSSASLAPAEAAPKPPNSKLPGLLPQGLPSSIPLALALSNAGLPPASPYFPILPGRGSAPLPMSQGNPNLGNLLNIKTEVEGSPAVESSPFLGKAVNALVQDKLSEPWKVYLRRFGTKDFCDAQCDFLHKAHFHCVVEECGALFSTLDGAIKHANFHFRTEGGAAKGSSEAPFPAAAETKPSLAPSSPPAPPASVAAASSLEGLAPSPATVPSTPTLLAWKQLASTIPQMPQIPTSVPHLPTSPLATTSLENAKPQVKPGFLQFQENDPCLATDCKYANKFHFHCLFGNCKYVCKTSGKAESHCLDHINPNNNLVNVRDQFAYYSLQCLCPNQHCEFRMRGHYHCLRTGCYFVTNITTKLPWHIKKHEKAERRAANGFKYFTKREECGRLGCKYNQVNSHFHCIREGCQFSFLLKHQMTSHARKHMRRMLGKNFDRVPPSQGPPSLMDPETDEYMDYTGCSPGAVSSGSSTMDRSCSSTPVGNESTAAGNTISMPTASGAKKRFWIIEDMSPFGKRRKTASSRKMLDEGMMLEGFRRFDLYEDCKDAACQFSLKVTHYHCTRENCGYKFCGRTHMYKHAQHHDRVDNLVLDDFKRFKASLSCHFADCPFSGTSTHFHCLRCRFRCTDSTKVTAHRKHHGKQDVISAAGFRQFSSSADCAVPDCKYKLKCSHFHCTYPGCRHTVVGMSQMDSHKRKHEKQERGEPPAASPGPGPARAGNGAYPDPIRMLARLLSGARPERAGAEPGGQFLGVRRRARAAAWLGQR
ncbi:PREDICTED: zinc finger protein castor homolog 1 [Condylura cristata]|uniref:zinc finger protein castor homolog 1 n=1 Tax=Condylura cristata TaxID=143302 RepID=UPI000643A4D6|nr:PREDICTED: zinc finger protein castor homolog 1 [Condylura cristata]